MNAAMLGPAGATPVRRRTPAALFQFLALSTASMTCSRGMASTRPNRSPASTPPTWMVDSEHDPISTVVTPWRTDSGRPGPVEHLDVVVGVDVDEPGQHPLAGGIDHLRATGLVEFVRGHRGDAAVLDADIADRRGRAGSVEPAAVADDRVEAHDPIEPAGQPGVNDARSAAWHRVRGRCGGKSVALTRTRSSTRSADQPRRGPASPAGPAAAPSPAAPGCRAGCRRRPAGRRDSG